MSKKREISYLNERISWDIETVNVLLEIIADDRVENLMEAQVLASLALFKGRQIDKKNEKIDRILLGLKGK